jgi:hypothetical protein
MQPIPVSSFNTTRNNSPILINKKETNEDIVSEVSEDVPTNNDETTVETNNKNEEIITQ